jgi:hypothetical protein
LEIADAGGAPPFGTAIGYQHRIFGKHRNQRIQISRRRSLRKSSQQASMRFLWSGEQSLFSRHIFSGALKQLSASRFVLADQFRDLRVFEVENIAKEQNSAFGWREPLKHYQERHRDLIEHLQAAEAAFVEINRLR